MMEWAIVLTLAGALCCPLEVGRLQSTQLLPCHRLFPGFLQLTPHPNDTLASFKTDPQVATSERANDKPGDCHQLTGQGRGSCWPFCCLLGLELQTQFASAGTTLLVCEASFPNGDESDPAQSEPAGSNIIVQFSSKSV